MTGIFVFGDNSTYLRNSILARLSCDYDIVYITEKSVVRKGRGYELMFCDLTDIKGIYFPKCIAVMKESGCFPNIALGNDTVIIANAENERQIQSLSNKNAHIITCGSKPSDTVSYTGFCENEVVVSLNREIKALSERVIQPLEIPLEISGESLYNIMAVTALKLVLDDFSSELGKLYR